MNRMKFHPQNLYERLRESPETFFRTSGTIDTAIAIPATRREFMRVSDTIRKYKSTVTNLIIETYGRIK